ncbi:KxDL motif containing 1 [Phyllostomus discolor]|uniref:KxDL motif-containing protein 1 n=1 Tax=Phyllostomus discolor TaxID=89673 RepID=A0A833ZIR2_9CHIR|nr:KxDL motif containing 1 [Phyllostomus discolor]
MDPPDSASRVFCSRILSMVNVDDVNAIILAQKNMLDRFEKTNEMLANFNNLSSARLQQMSERFLHHTRTLVEMKRDLDSIFRRIRTLKGKLARQHPEAFSRKCHPGLLCPMSGLCNTWMTALSVQGWLFKGYLRGWWAAGPERPGAEGRGGGASLAFLAACRASAGSRVPSLGGGDMGKHG